MKKHITSVTATNLKSSESLEHKLAPLTLITGQNGAGKSAIIDALYLATLGYHPLRGKTGPAIAELAGPGMQLSAHVEFSDLKGVTRSWKRTAKGLSVTLAGPDEPPFDLVSLDPNAFLSANIEKRAAMIAARFNIEGDPKAAILAAVRKALGSYDKEFKLPAKMPEDFAEWVESVSEVLKAGKSAAASMKKRMKATLEGKAALTDGAPPSVDAQALDDARTSKARFTAAIEEARKTAAQALADIRELPQAHGEPPDLNEAVLKDRLVKVEEALSLIEAQRLDFTRSESSRRLITSSIATNRQRAKSLSLWLDENPEVSLVEPEEITSGGDTGPKGVRHFEDEIFHLESAIHRIEQSLATMKGELAGERKNQLVGETCPCCGAKRDAWDEQQTWEREEAFTALSEKIIETEKADKQKREELSAAKATLARVKGYFQALTDAQERDAKAKEHEALNAEHAKLEAELSGLPLWTMEQAEELDALTDEKAELEEKIEIVANHREAIEAKVEHDRLEAIINGAQTARDMAAADLEKAEQELAALEAKAKAYAEYEANQKERDKAQNEYDNADKELTAWGAALDELQTASDAETVKVLKPMLEIARKLTRDCLPTELDHKGLDIGRWVGAHFVKLSTFSKSEQAVALAGITAALAASGSGLVILDEFSTLDPRKKVAFLENVIAAIEDGTLAQAILIDNQPFPPITFPPFGCALSLGA